jgi:DNA-binding transcriptional LysR family regulator
VAIAAPDSPILAAPLAERVRRRPNAPRPPARAKDARAKLAPISAQALCAAPFVVREVGSGSKSLVERALADRGLTVNPVMSLGSTEAIKRAVIEGVGVAIVSRLAVEAELAAGRLVELPVRALTVERPLYLLTAGDRTRGAAVAAFLRVLGETAGRTL